MARGMGWLMIAIIFAFQSVCNLDKCSCMVLFYLNGKSHISQGVSAVHIIENIYPWTVHSNFM